MARWGGAKPDLTPEQQQFVDFEKFVHRLALSDRDILVWIRQLIVERDSWRLVAETLSAEIEKRDKP